MAIAPISIGGAEKISPVIFSVVEEVDERQTDKRHENCRYVNSYSFLC